MLTENRRRELFRVDQSSTRLQVCVPREKFRMILKRILKPCDNRSRRLTYLIGVEQSCIGGSLFMSAVFDLSIIINYRTFYC